ncbi:MAG: transcription termination factor NusA [Trichlorobacter sp.]|nr:transcription termination factor NusA [Trichlorobacter sp.]
MDTNVNLKQAIEQVVKEKGIDYEVVIEAMEQAVLSAANRKYRNTRTLEAHYNHDTGEVELFEYFTVVEDVQDSYKEVTLEEAQELDPECQIGDELGEKIDSGDFGRIAAQSAKQVIIQKVREAERETVFNEYKDRLWDVVTGQVRRFERGDLLIDLGRADAVLPAKAQMPREVLRPGDRVRAIITDILMTPKGPQIMLSRIHPQMLAKLFEAEVPEISEGLVEIINVVRDPGIRAKIAVTSHDRDIDPVGACVGMRGSRVQNVVSELRGEKIDIIPWSADIVRFVCNALAPAQVVKVFLDEEQRALEVIVPDDQLSLAIGKRGQNVSLAAKLTGCRIDIKAEGKTDSAELDDFASFDGTHNEVITEDGDMPEQQELVEAPENMPSNEDFAEA